jgi:hypothetical protein
MATAGRKTSASILENNRATFQPYRSGYRGMSGRPAEALAACGEAGKRARLTPNDLAAAMALVCSWRFSTGGSTTTPAQLQARIVRLANPELKLTLDYARALRMKRVGATNSRAAKLGYVTLSRRAASLADRP